MMTRSSKMSDFRTIADLVAHLSKYPSDTVIHGIKMPDITTTVLVNSKGQAVVHEYVKDSLVFFTLPPKPNCTME